MFQTRQGTNIIKKILAAKKAEEDRLELIERLKPKADTWPEQKEKYFPSQPITILEWDEKGTMKVLGYKYDKCDSNSNS